MVSKLEYHTLFLRNANVLVHLDIFVRELKYENSIKNNHRYIISEKDAYNLLEISNLFHYRLIKI